MDEDNSCDNMSEGSSCREKQPHTESEAAENAEGERTWREEQIDSNDKVIEDEKDDEALSQTSFLDRFLYEESDGGYSSPKEPHLPEDNHGGRSFLTWESALEYLGKDNTLLRPFQEAKRKQLQKERDFLLLQIRQAEQQINDAENDNLKLGSQLYSLQEELTRAQVKLDETKCEKERRRASKLEKEENLRKVQKEDENIAEKILHLKEREKELQHEMSSSDRKHSTMKFLSERCDSELISIRNALQGTLNEGRSLLKNRDFQEFHLENLKASIKREENTLKILEDASERAAKEVEAIKEATKIQEEELREVEQETKAVEKAWEENVFLLEKRSKNYTEALETLLKLRAEESGLRNEVVNIRKEIIEAQMEHEKSTHRFLRLRKYAIEKQERLTSAEENLVREMEKKTELEEDVAKLSLQYSVAKRKYESEFSSLSTVYKRLQTTTERQRNLEDVYFERLNQQTNASKANENLKNQIRKLKEKGRQLEDQLVLEEHTTAKEALRVSDLKNDLMTSQAAQERVREMLNEVQAKAEKLECEKRRKEEKIKSNTNILDRLKKELQKILNFTGGEEVSPLEREERALQIDLKDAEKELLNLERELISLQREILANSKAKQRLEEMEHQLNKEIHLLQSRTTRLRSELEEEEISLRKERQLRKKLEATQKKIDNKLYEEGETLKEETHLSGVIETEIVESIKELKKILSDENSHLETIQTQLRVAEDDLENSSREKKIWENRLEAANEAKEEFLKEMGAEGETEAMKKEINRMNARWHTLEATQRELSYKMAKSVDIEEVIKHKINAVLENSLRNPNSAKATKEMQIDSIKRKINRNQKTLKEIQESLEALQEEKVKIQDEIQIKQRSYMINVKLLQESENSLQEKLAIKQADLMLVQEERLRLRLLTTMKENRYRCLAASNKAAQKSLHSSLLKKMEAYRNVIAQLTAAFPHLIRPLSSATRLLNVKISKDLG